MRAGALLVLAAIACSPRAPEPAAPAPRRDVPYVALSRVALPPMAREGLPPSLREAWDVSDEVVRETRDEPGVTSFPEFEIRAWHALGWMPSQATRRARYEHAVEVLRARPVDATRDRILAVVVTARMQEALAADWRGIVADECKGDPQICRAGGRLKNGAQRTWLERAREGYRTCEALSYLQDGVEVWTQHCRDRAAQLASRLHELEAP